MKTPRGLFVTGTDTSVGKTYVTAAIARTLVLLGRHVGALKPVSTSAELQPDGSLASPDAIRLRTAIDTETPLSRIAPILFEGDVAPSVAMRLASRVLDHADLVRSTVAAIQWWSDKCDLLIVEGVGGILCPLTEGSTVADLAVALDYPLVIVARRGLGTLNHTLLTVEAARLRGLRIAGVVLNGSEPTSNVLAESSNSEELVRHLREIPILAELPYKEAPETLNAAMHGVDWWGLSAWPRLSPEAALSGPS